MQSYIVLEHNKIPSLAKEVNETMKLGYFPIGGISKWSKGGATGFMQALVLIDEVKDKKWYKL